MMTRQEAINKTNNIENVWDLIGEIFSILLIGVTATIAGSVFMSMNVLWIASLIVGIIIVASVMFLIFRPIYKDNMDKMNENLGEVLDIHTLKDIVEKERKANMVLGMAFVIYVGFSILIGLWLSISPIPFTKFMYRLIVMGSVAYLLSITIAFSIYFAAVVKAIGPVTDELRNLAIEIGKQNNNYNIKKVDKLNG